MKGYARLIESVDADGSRIEVRDSRIPRELWRRIVDEGRASDVWSIGTVRLAGSGLIGGTPAVTVIGIRFDDTTLSQIVGEHGAQ